MSEHGPSLMVCGCGYDRFKVSGKNLVRCQSCGSDLEITPSFRYIGPNTADRLLDEQAQEAFERMRGK